MSGRDLYALAIGLFLGLAIVKFGNPVILDQKIPPPRTFEEVWGYAWPGQWGYWLLAPLALMGVAVAFTQSDSQGRRTGGGTSRDLGVAQAGRESRDDRKSAGQGGLSGSARRWLWLFPVAWLGWQLVSATRTVDGELTMSVLGHFAACVALYFIGEKVLGDRRVLPWLLIGILAAFAFCLVRAVNQKLFEFPVEHQLLLEGERTGWTNFTEEVVVEMKRSGAIIHTNGVDAANPVFLAKYGKGRVYGTMVYPNALAGAVLLLWPISLAVAFHGTRNLRATIRRTVIGLTCLMGAAGLFWTGSKLGWLVALALAVLCLLRLEWPRRWKYALLAGVTVVGLVVFAVRFQHYFASGATSLGARFDYWRAAVQIVRENPLLGTGPGTFQRPYAEIKSPEAEMARLAHNDYLEQFSDSGLPGGLGYLGWIALALWHAGRQARRADDPLVFAVFAGLLAWFAQGIGEFSLYVPALAWTAFTLLGWLVGTGWKSNRQNPGAQIISGCA